MEKKTLGFAMCGSFCTFKKAIETARSLAGEFELVPIMSEISAGTDTRFGRAADFRAQLEEICSREVISTIAQAEPIGPKKLLDALLILPCTGNTLAKLANGVADSSVTLAAKAHLRNERPVVLAVSTNDGLGANAASIGKLLARKHVFFVPFRQEDACGKPCSLVADFSLAGEAVRSALGGVQLQPVLA